MRLIDADTLSEHKFVGNKFIQIGGRRNGKTLEAVNRAYQQGWNDAIDAIIDNAPTIKPTITCKECDGYEAGYSAGQHDARPKGEWIFKHNSSDVWCSNCDISLESNLCEGIKFRYCPNCGADMRGGRE